MKWLTFRPEHPKHLSRAALPENQGKEGDPGRGTPEDLCLEKESDALAERPGASSTAPNTVPTSSLILSETPKVGVSGSDLKLDFDFRSGCLKPVGFRMRLLHPQPPPLSVGAHPKLPPYSRYKAGSTRAGAGQSLPAASPAPGTALTLGRCLGTIGGMNEHYTTVCGR